MIKVLIADDQELIRESLKIVLGTHEDIQVVDVASDEASIVKGLQKVLSPNFRAFCKTTTNPYEKEGTAESIFKVISTYSLDTFLQKSFYNL